MKRVFHIILVFVLVFVFSGTALAADDAQDQAPGGDPGLDYTYIDYATIYFSINASGYASMAAVLQGTAGVDHVRISAYLQRYNSGWSTVQHYTAEDDSDYINWSAGRYVTSGYTYRLLVYFYAYVGDNYESTSRWVSDTY